MQIHLVEIDQ
jgi:hypothetical protein